MISVEKLRKIIKSNFGSAKVFEISMTGLIILRAALRAALLMISSYFCSRETKGAR